MRVLRPARLLLAAMFLCIGGRALPAQRTAAYKVVVHASNPVDGLTPGEVSHLFLKKVTIWKGGEPAYPVDLTPASATREAFSWAIHRRHVPAIKGYWQVQLYSGREVPPPEMDNDAAVLEYVRTHPNAIGYVSAGTPLGNDVRVLAVSER